MVIVGSVVYERGYEAGSIVPTEKDAYESFAKYKRVPEHYEPFHALPYSLENSFPLVRLGVQDKWAPASDVQGSTWQPHTWSSRFLLPITTAGFVRWFRWVQICFGWILTTLFVAGVSGIIRRD